MSVYVDTLVNYGKRIGRFGSEWCHLMADSDEELHAFAARLGMRELWFQHDPQRPWRNHYDLTKTRRSQAVRLGAVEITRRQAAELMRTKQGAA